MRVGEASSDAYSRSRNAEALLNVIAELGHQALSIGELDNPFDEFQNKVLFYGSFGGTKPEIADILSAELGEKIEEDQIAEARDQIIAHYEDAPNFAAAVARAIENKHLLIEVNKNPSVNESLSKQDLALIKIFREGKDMRGARKILGIQRSNMKRLMPSFCNKLSANGRTHSVRRSYELGILMPESQS